VPMPMPPARPAVMPRRSSTRALVGNSSRRMIHVTNPAIRREAVLAIR
jgi:hypothetical protein